MTGKAFQQPRDSGMARSCLEKMLESMLRMRGSRSYPGDDTFPSLLAGCCLLWVVVSHCTCFDALPLSSRRFRRDDQNSCGLCLTVSGSWFHGTTVLSYSLARRNIGRFTRFPSVSNETNTQKKTRTSCRTNVEIQSSIVLSYMLELQRLSRIFL